MQRGFSLVELMVVVSLASLLTVASSQWFISVISVLRTQHLLIESHEVGRFALSYFSKALARGGAGLGDADQPIQFDGNGLKIRYRAQLPFIGTVRNCLGNKSNVEIIEDFFLIDEYDLGGFELKCISSGLGDWLTEGVYRLEFQVAVDRGSFVGETFIFDRFDGIPDAYLPSDQFVSGKMRPVALRVKLVTYRPMDVSQANPNYWAKGVSGEILSHTFNSLIILPNG